MKTSALMKLLSYSIFIIFIVLEIYALLTENYALGIDACYLAIPSIIMHTGGTYASMNNL